VNLTRYHGVFAPNHRLRALIVPGRRGSAGTGQGGAVPRRAAMNWAQRLKRVFGIEIERCAYGGAPLKIIASIEDPEVISRILSHLERRAVTAKPPRPGAPLHALTLPRAGTMSPSAAEISRSALPWREPLPQPTRPSRF
jgi:hypothetical protein